MIVVVELDQCLKEMINKMNREITAELEEQVKRDLLDNLIKRAKGGALLSEADYMAGAMVAMGRVTGAVDKDEIWSMATPWVFMILGNRSIVARELEKRGEKTAAKIIEEKQEKFIRRVSHLNELVGFVELVYKEAGTSSVGSWISGMAEELLEDIGEELP